MRGGALLLAVILSAATCLCHEREGHEGSCVSVHSVHHRLRIASPPHLSAVSGPFEIRVEYSHRILPGHDGPESLAKGFRIFIDGDIAAEQAFGGERHRRFWILSVPALAQGTHTFEASLVFEGTPEQQQAPLAVEHRVHFRSEGFDAREVPPRVRVPGEFEVAVRRRSFETGEEENSVEVWKASETAFVVCDMWGFHGCAPAALRVEGLVHRMNQVLLAARDRGVLIVHAPSSGVEEMSPAYPVQRRRARVGLQHCVPPSCLAAGLVHAGRAVEADPSREPELPFKAGCDDGGSEAPPHWDDETHAQHPGLLIFPQDALSDVGAEIVGLFRAEGIRNVVVMGVHANECLLKRPFGVRQLSREGFGVLVARDLTDALYDPRDPPHVSHARGTALVIEHVERYVCGSTLGGGFLRLRGEPE